MHRRSQPRTSRPPSPPGALGAPDRPVRRRQPRRGRGELDDGQPGRPGLHGAQAGRSGAGAGSVTADWEPGPRVHVSLLTGPTSDVVRRFVKPVTKVERDRRRGRVAMSGHSVTEVGPGRVPVLAAAAGYLACTLVAPRSSGEPHAGDRGGHGGRRGAGGSGDPPDGGHPHALRRLNRSRARHTGRPPAGGHSPRSSRGRVGAGRCAE